MPLPDGPPGGDAIRLAAGAADLAGTLVLAAAVAAALTALLRGRGGCRPSAARSPAGRSRA